MIVDSNEGVPLEEETKENITPSISDSIYGKEYTLIHILWSQKKIWTVTTKIRTPQQKSGF